MPGVALHLHCAHRALLGWRAAPTPPHLRLHEPDVVEAFYQGALGPDMGYFRAGGRWLSDLAHLNRPADLARAMVERARDPVQLAYAWGWVTHVLADIAIHPLINRATGELLHGTTGRSVTGAESPGGHLRVELGLDAYIHRRHLDGEARFASVITGGRARFVASAFRRVHGKGVGLSDVVESQSAVVRLTPLMLAMNGVVGEVHRRARRRGSPVHVPPVRDASSPGEGGPGVVRGFLSPVPPRPWLIREVMGVVRGFPKLFLEHYRDDLRDLANCDLDTGATARSGAQQHLPGGLPALERPMRAGGFG